MRYILVLFSLCVFFSTDLVCEINLPSNKEITLRLINDFIDTLAKSLVEGKYWVEIGTNPISSVLESNIISKLSERQLQFYTFNCDSCTNLLISVNKFEISYKRIRREKPTNQIIRKLDLGLTALIKPPHSIVRTIEFYKTFSDTLTSEQIDNIERDGVPFTAQRPKEPENFIKKYFEPMIIIASTTLAILLFFTVRAK